MRTLGATAIDLGRFTWERYPSGYTIVSKTPQPVPGRWLETLGWGTTASHLRTTPDEPVSGVRRLVVPREPREKPQVFKPFHKQTSRLFERFCSADSDDDILGFATEYGLLGISMRTGQTGLPAPEDVVDDWKKHAQLMRFCLARYDSRRQILLLKDARGTMDAVNIELRERIAPELTMDPRSAQVSLSVRPVSLLGALWYQAAMSMERTTEYESCRFCGQLFEVGATSPTGRNRGTRFCSVDCRIREFRLRARAVKLRKEGKPLQAIVHETKRSRYWIEAAIAKDKQKKGR